MFISTFRIKNRSVLKMMEAEKKTQYFPWHWNSIHCRRRQQQQQQQPKKIIIFSFPFRFLWSERTHFKMLHFMKNTIHFDNDYGRNTCNQICANLLCYLSMFLSLESGKERERAHWPKQRVNLWHRADERERQWKIDASVCGWFYLRWSTLHTVCY